MIKVTPFIPNATQRTILRSKMPFLRRAQFNSSSLKNLRDDLRSYLYTVQDGRCAYCMGEISSDIGELEHIACLSIFPKYLFHFRNLVLSCSVCNKNKRIHEQKIARLVPNSLSHASYKKSLIFNIVHPIHDTPQIHFQYDVNNIILLKTLTQKGRRTKKYLKLDYPYQTAQRAKLAKIRNMPLTPSNERLLQLISANFRLRSL